MKEIKKVFFRLFFLGLITIFYLPASARADWTFMVYLDGDNNLESAGIDDFLEMADVGSDQNLDIIVQFDRIDGYSTDYGDWKTTKRFRVTSGMTPTAANQISDIGEANMGDPQTLINFVNWAMQSFPSSNYALVFWNHGGGWRERMEELRAGGKEDMVFKAVCWDETDGDDCLYMKEVKNALSSIISGVQLVGMDACVMGMVEVAYEIKDYGDVLVYSEASEPGDGWPYDTILADLNSNISWTAAQLGSDIVDRYYESYGNDETQSAIDLGEMDDLAASVSDFAQKMIDHWDDDQNAIITAAEAVKAKVEDAVINEKHGDSWPGAYGLAIYFPETGGSFDSDYNGTVIDFPGATKWDEFLQDFYSSMGSSWIAQKRSVSQEFYYGEHIDLYHFCDLLGSVPEVYYVESQIGNEFSNSGTARNWRADDESWSYDLPFDFPFFRQTYDSVYVCSNGYLDFASSSADYTNSAGELAANVRIAPIWTDLKTNGSAQAGEDIYIDEYDELVIIRWKGETYSWVGAGDPVNVEVVLYRDGRIKFNYGSGNQNVTPTVGISKGDGTNYLLSVYNGQSNLSYVSSDLYTPVSSILPAIDSGDYDGDGSSDIAVFRDGSGLWALRGMTRVYFGSSGDRPVSADYDGDGTTEIAVFRSASGLWAVRGLSRFYFGTSSDTAVPGDYNGDGSCEACIFRPDSGLWAIRGFTRLYFGSDGDTAVPGDYDGDGTKEAGVFRPGSGLWAIRGVTRLYFGSEGDTAVPGDYDGGGSWRSAVFRSSSGMWAVRGVTRIYFGSSGDRPVPADYDGTMADNYGIFRDSSGLWAIRGFSRIYFGQDGDLPVTR